MLPSSKQSLMDGGSTSKAASWILIACFLGGVFGIQLFSRVVHHFMPSHAVDCDHTHDEDAQGDHHSHGADGHGHDDDIHDHQAMDDAIKHKQDGRLASENTPLLSRSAIMDGSQVPEVAERRKSMPVGLASFQRPSFQSRMTSTVAHIVSTSKGSCDVNGPCHGYSDPCGQECFKKVAARGGGKHSISTARRPAMRTTASAAMPSLEPISSDGELEVRRPHDGTNYLSLTDGSNHKRHQPNGTVHTQNGTADENASEHSDDSSNDLEAGQSSSGHHHHVPQNAFLSISLQTSIAIALHKLPEGFITYATNHANPSLGVTVFLAIAVHNISEGFALALPIYLASGSRVKALFLSLLLGGLSQPIGAGVAAAWLKIAEKDRGAGAEKGLSDGVYGGMFAVTAGIMASVAISLIQESFELSHNRNLCLACIFIGMGILGMSSALTA